MENLSGNMAENMTSNTGKIKKKKKRNTILLVGESGEIKKIGWIRWLVYFLVILLILTTAAAGVFYVLSEQRNQELRKAEMELKIAKNRLKQVQLEKERLMASLVIAKSELNKEEPVSPGNELPEASVAEPGKNSNEPEGEPAAGPKDDKKSADSGENSPETDTPEKVNNSPETKKNDVPAEPPVISVEKFSVSRAGKTIWARFDIRNLGDDRVSGRIIIVLRDSGDDPSRWLTLPDVKLQGKKPSGKEKGRSFSIARFNTIKLKAYSKRDPGVFERAGVYIFSMEGKPLLEKEFDIELK